MDQDFLKHWTAAGAQPLDTLVLKNKLIVFCLDTAILPLFISKRVAFQSMLKCISFIVK